MTVPELTIPTSLSPFDAGLIFVGYTFGLISLFSRLRGVATLLQVALLITKMARHYYDTHPDAKKMIDADIDAAFDRLYQKKLVAYDKEYKTGEETGAAG